MPIPLIPLIIGGATVVAGAFGIGKSIKAGIDSKKANSTNKDANSIIKNAKWRLNTSRLSSRDAIEKLGTQKLEILDKGINRFVKSFEQLRNIEIENSVGLQELNKFKMDKQSFAELKEMGNFATSVLGGVSSGTLGGAITAFGAWGAAGHFAAASTGTLIANLSGAAATNATLAFFGGGSLAVGGLGVAGGTMVLGGIIAGPALAIMGLIVGAKANTEKEKALENLATARKTAEELKAASDVCIAIRKRCYLFIELLERLTNLFNPLLSQMESAIKEHGADYSLFNIEQKKAVAGALSLAGTIKAVIDTPILNKDGKLTDESAKIIREINNSI